MSQVYSLEPPTAGKVVLRTSLGDLDVELWPKEAPRAVRNFVQLCLEGYYDHTIFHRIVKGFMVQGGDPTGTGLGGESIYGHPFRDEFHSRLKFSHRGIIACANQNAPDTNGAQFFITLERADHLDRKATIFGKITGDTIYNLSRFESVETDADDKPVDNPPLITRADVLWNPFDDIVPRMDRDAKRKAAEAVARKEASKSAGRKGARDFKLISFGDEAEEEDAAEAKTAARMKIKSAHDALEDSKLSKEAAVEVDIAKVREAMRMAKTMSAGPGIQDKEQRTASVDDEHLWAAKMREGVQKKRKLDTREDFQTVERLDSDAEPEEKMGGGAHGLVDHAYIVGKHVVEGKDSRSNVAVQRDPKFRAGAVVAPSRQILVQDHELLTEWQRRRQEYKERKRLGGSRDRDTMSKLALFMEKIKDSKKQSGNSKYGGSQDELAEGSGELKEGGYGGKVDANIDHRSYMPAAWRVDEYLEPSGEIRGEVDDNLETLKGHRLVFAERRERDALARSDNLDDYIVHDPLLEAGKAKFNRRQNGQRKRETEWAGSSRD